MSHIPKKWKQLKELEGCVNVNDDVTPITRRPIEQLDSTLWPDMPTPQLIDQRTILFNRIVDAQRVGATHMADQMMIALKVLDAMLEERDDNIEMHLV